MSLYEILYIIHSEMLTVKLLHLNNVILFSSKEIGSSCLGLKAQTLKQPTVVATS